MKTNQLTHQAKSKHVDTEKRVVVTRGGAGGEGQNGKLYGNRQKLNFEW